MSPYFNAETVRDEHAAKLIDGIERALKAGNEVLIQHDAVTIRPHGSKRGIMIAGRHVRDALAHALQLMLNDLAEAAHERAELRERLDAGTEPTLSSERDLRVAP